MEGRKVKIYDDWLGIVIQEGDCQSLVKVTSSDDPELVGKNLVFINSQLIDIIQENEMSSVTELTTEYNEIAKSRGLPEVKKFRDKATAEKRLAAIKVNNGGSQDRNDIVNRFKFKKSMKPNLREKLLHKLLDRKNQWCSKRDLGDLVVHISGLKWCIETRNITELEIREEKKEGQWYYGIFETRVHKEREGSS